MSEERNRWLPVVRSLAREVAVEDYIRDVDGRIGRAQRTKSAWHRRMWVWTALLIASMTAASYRLGYRFIGPQQSAVLAAVYRVEPHPERWAEADLLTRLSIRRDAMGLLELAASPSTSDRYPYLAELTGHPDPLVEPGRGPALMLLANALQAFPVQDRGRMIDRIVSVAAALGDSDLQQALTLLSNLERPARQELFSNGAAGLKHIIEAQSALDSAVADQRKVADELDRQREMLQTRTSWVARQVEVSKTWIAKLGSVERACRRDFEEFRQCLQQARGGTQGHSSNP